MNLFYLSSDPVQAARYHCDQHVRKMLIEYAQMMSTAHRVLDGDDDRFYKKTHANHPTSVWVRSSRMSYFYTYNIWAECAAIYRESAGRDHATWSKLSNLLLLPPMKIPDGPAGPPPQCMDECFKQDDTVLAYQAMYRDDKSRFATFKYNGTPYFMENVNENRTIATA